MVKLKKKKAGGDKYRYTALIDTKYSMNNVDVGLHSNDKSAIKSLNALLKRKFPKEKPLKEIKLKITEHNNPPMKPSHVLLGEALIFIFLLPK